MESPFLAVDEISDSRGVLKYFEHNVNLPFSLKGVAVLNLSRGVHTENRYIPAYKKFAFVLLNGSVQFLNNEIQIEKHKPFNNLNENLDIRVLSDTAIILLMHGE